MIRCTPGSFDRTHLGIFLGFYLAFTLLYDYGLMAGGEVDRRDGTLVAAVLFPAAGPFVGAIARNMQSCCLAASCSIALFSGLFLAAGAALQVVPLPMTWLTRAFRLSAWTIALFGWFGGGPVSLMHALG